MNQNKIALIGAGQIGGTLALLSAQKNLGDIILFDVYGKPASGKALDLNQASTVNTNEAQLKGTDDYADIKDADVCIVTAGFPRLPGMSRDDLLQKNLEVINQVSDGIKKHAPNAFVIIITNPLDIMVYAFCKRNHFNKNKIVGMAGVLDAARFRTFLAWELGVSREDVHTMVLGGHGDTMVPLIRFTSVNGISLQEFINNGILKENKLQEMITRTRKGGGEIVELLGRGSAFYAPAISAIKMAESFLYDQKRLLPCAAYLNGQYGVKDMFLGVPIIIGKNGVEKIIELNLNKEEQIELNQSIYAVKKCIVDVDKAL